VFSFLERELILIFKNYVIPSIIGIVIALIFNSFFAIIKVDGTSMNPTLNDGDFLLGYKKYKSLKQGDIIVATINRFDTKEKEIIIKRIIALEGQTISIKNGKVIIDDEILNENYALSMTNLEDMNEIVIPEDEVFLMGDNRDNSLDSRIQGTINIKDILMKIL